LLEQVTADVVPFAWNAAGQTYSSADGYQDGDERLPASLNYKGTTYIPIRLLAETLGYDVQWDDASKTATIAAPDANDDPSEGLPSSASDKPKQILSNAAVTNTNATLLSGPDASAAAIDVIPSGTTVNVGAETSRDWLQVEYDGHTGYLQPSATNYRFEADRPAWEQTADAIIASGLQQLGKPYKFGASSSQTDTFDCSSFTKYVFGLHGVKLPRVSRQQSQQGKDVSLDSLRKGDLLFFTTPARKNKTGLDHIGHVAIYLGNGQLLHTYRVGIGVTVTALDNNWESRLVSAKRVLG
jgi:cell wall-associated NlpC family hydrolase